MSRIIEFTNTVIKKPELLREAVNFLNNTQNHKNIKDTYQTDKNGRILGACFQYSEETRTFGAARVFLKYHGKEKPSYSNEGILENGHYTLAGDQDIQENRELALLIADSYAAHTIKEILENRGHLVQIELENGEFIIDGFETQQEISPCSY